LWPRLRPRAALWAVLASALVLGAAGISYQITHRAGLAALDQRLADRLTVTRHSVVSEIERFRYLPSVVGRDARILALLAAGPEDDAARMVPANLYLEAVRALSAVDELYLLDAQGRTVAASNWNRPGSFLGQDYAFRPYFRDAMRAGEGRYYAVGVTTGKPGYFLAARIGPAEAPLGVAVVKVDMAPLEATWVRGNEAVGLADDFGVVFLAGRKAWRYRPLTGLAQGPLALLWAERRYEGLDLAAAAPLVDDDRILSAADGPMRLATEALEPDGWRILAAEPLGPVTDRARLVAALSGLGMALAVVLGLIWRQRRQIVRLRLDQADWLEARVAERTRALAHEVEERRRAEDELRRTHDSLVHAAKLAVLGRMSSSIVHEVSQPLSALDTTLAAAELHLRGADPERVGRSLASARALLHRMQEMVRTLKRFGARQKPGAPEPVDLAAVVATAAEVLEPRLRELRLSLRADLAPGLPPVAGQPAQLQQVLTNLALNAAEAQRAAHPEAADDPPVEITARTDGARLRVTIADRGPGIPEELRAQIFEPFFTTRTSGEGLGLGLAITRTILEHMGAGLAFAARPGGGTLAELDLPIFKDPR
ncbi:MAG: sensor histidine kinase, partial [Sphingomonadales bacterium]|nr:sensor histidine kinase [Sphingomonadales bacterium]